MILQLSKFIKASKVHARLLKFSCALIQRNINHFTLATKKTQLILHSEGEVQKIHGKRQQKDKPWSRVTDEKNTQFRVSLIGLPNSGKSTLFNCLAGESLAIVDKLAGMTRDRREYQIMDGLVKIIDTPGVEVSALSSREQNTIKCDIFKQTITAVHESDLIIVVIDARKPIGSDEVEMVKYLRKFDKNKKLLLACNKTEKAFDETFVMQEMSKLNISDMFMTSGEAGTGIFQIMERINKQIPVQFKQNLQHVKKKRVEKFQKLITKLKNQLKLLQQKGINIKQWEIDFRKINPDPQFNKDLDYQEFQQFIVRPELAFNSTRGAEAKNLKLKNTIKICFIGRPNVGKSSLINQILGEDRMVISKEANTTRDSISSKIVYKGRKIEVVDTAGIDNHNIERTQQQYLRKVMHSTKLHMKQSHVVVYVMDAYSAFKIEDFHIIRQSIEEGRPVVIAVNKWEAIKQQYKYKAKNYLLKQIDTNLGHMIHGHPLVFVSAKMSEGIDRILDNVINSYDKWNTRISTGLLNDWLVKFKKLDNLPKDNEMTLKINYIIQAKVRPPHFIFFVNNKKLFKDNYMRFVTENIAQQFKLDSIPFKITLKSTNNKQNENKGKKNLKIKKASPIKQKMEELKKKYNNFGL